MDLSFDAVKDETAYLAQKIKTDGFYPDFIVGLARGGWIPARLLSNELRVKKILSYGVTYADDARTSLTVYSAPDPFPAQKKILLIEDCLESGKSLEFAQQEFLKTGNAVKCAALFITEKSVFIPHYYNKKLPQPPVFPWE